MGITVALFYDSYVAFSVLPFTQLCGHIKSVLSIFKSHELVAPYSPRHLFGLKMFDCTNGLAIGTLLVPPHQVTAENSYSPLQLISVVNKQKRCFYLPWCIIWFRFQRTSLQLLFFPWTILLSSEPGLFLSTWCMVK